MPPCWAGALTRRVSVRAAVPRATELPLRSAVGSDSLSAALPPMRLASQAR